VREQPIAAERADLAVMTDKKIGRESTEVTNEARREITMKHRESPR
jgi:hypothetical protein